MIRLTGCADVIMTERRENIRTGTVQYILYITALFSSRARTIRL